MPNPGTVQENNQTENLVIHGYLLNRIYAEGLENIFPQCVIAMSIFASMPVSVAEGERTFSKLNLIKNYLRPTMGEERLNSLVLLSCERDLARKVNYDGIIEAFA